MTQPFTKHVVSDSDHLHLAMFSGCTKRSHYQLWGSRIYTEHKLFQFAPGVSIEECRMYSGVQRVDYVLDPGVLVIGVASSLDIRLLGVPLQANILCMGCGGVRVNAITFPPTSFHCVVFSPEVAQRVVPEERMPIIVEKMRYRFGTKGIYRAMRPAGDLLFAQMRELLADAEHLANGGAPSDAHLSLSLDDFIEMCVECVDEMVKDDDDVVPDDTPERRIELAHDIEEILWRAPQPGGPTRVSIDDVAKQLGCSRRSVQLAVNEVFGMGFVALKRAIRLHQASAVLREGIEPGAISRIARAYEFNHLSRFSIYYKEMFGVLPSTDGADRTASREEGARPLR